MHIRISNNLCCSFISLAVEINKPITKNTKSKSSLLEQLGSHVNKKLAKALKIQKQHGSKIKKEHVLIFLVKKE